MNIPFISHLISRKTSTSQENINLPLKNKILLKKEWAEKRVKVKSYPEEMTLATTIKCNINPPCVICERVLRKPEDESDIEDRILKRLEKVFPHLDILYLHCGGEPLIYHKFDYIIDKVKPPTKIRFNSNGIPLSQKRIEAIVNSKTVDVINFSFDAVTPETYKKLRGFGFEKVIDNIKNLTAYKKKVGSDKPVIIMNMCIMKENLDEVPMFPDLAKDLGAAGIDFFHPNTGDVFDWKLNRGDFTFDYKEQCKMDPEHHDEIILKTYKRCEELGLGMNFVGSAFLSNKNKKQKEEEGKKFREMDKPTTIKKCHAPWSRVVIGVNGHVRMCYYHQELDENIGNLNKHSFDKIWNNEKAIKIRQEFVDKGFATFCDKENMCMFMGRK